MSNEGNNGSAALATYQAPTSAPTASTALATTTAAPGLALEPRNFDEGMRLARVVVQSKMFGVESEAEAFIRLSTGMGLGLTAAQSLRAIHVIKGKPSIAADMMMALCVSSPACEFFECTETTDKRATFTAKRKGAAKAQTISFTIEDAQRAELTGNHMYKKYPAQMLRARCIAALARLVFPERMHGLYTPDELKTGAGSSEEEMGGGYVETTPMPPPAVAEAARSVARAAEAAAPDFTSQWASIADTLAGAATTEAIDAIAKDAGARLKGAGTDVRQAAKAAFDAARARVAVAGSNEATAAE